MDKDQRRERFLLENPNHQKSKKYKTKRKKKEDYLPNPTLYKIGETKGENNINWKGDAVGYKSVHLWIQKWKGKPTTCERCGKENLKGVQINWANIDHKYRRVLDDYIRLCAKCHRDYDIENNLRK